MKSWKTTLAGIFLALGLVFSQAGALLDDDPNTTMNWEQVVAALASIGGAIGLGFAARDNKVSSEDAGIK